MKERLNGPRGYSRAREEASADGGGDSTYFVRVVEDRPYFPRLNVDPANQQQVIDLIRGTCDEENVSLLMVTHATDVAEQFSRVDRLDEINRVLLTANQG